MKGIKSDIFFDLKTGSEEEGNGDFVASQKPDSKVSDDDGDDDDFGDFGEAGTGINCYLGIHLRVLI